MILRLLLIFYFFLAAPIVAAEVATKPCKELKVSGAIGWYPLLMSSGNSPEPEGIAIELLKIIANDLNLSVTFVAYPWKRMLQHLEFGSLRFFSIFTLENDEFPLIKKVP